MLISHRIWSQSVNGRRSVKGDGSDCNPLTKITLHHTFRKHRILALCNCKLWASASDIHKISSRTKLPM